MAQALAATLASVGRAVRDAVRAADPSARDATVLRTEGGDEIFGLDERAETAVMEALPELAPWPGRLVIEGHDAAVAVGGGGGPWRYLCDPVDGTRVWLEAKRSAWVLFGAGREASTLEDLEVGVAVEVPTRRAALGLVAWAVRGGPLVAVDDDLAGGGPPRPVTLSPKQGSEVDRRFVSVTRGLHRPQAPVAEWADTQLAHVRGQLFEDAYLSTGGQLMGLATGADAAVFDPRPLVGQGLCAHPYDLAALVVAREAGVVVEALPPGPLDVPLDTTTDVAWAGYANAGVAARLRPVLP